MIELDATTLRQLQMIQLEMLIEVDRICRKCNIQYNIIAGTLLGAVRHGGYIPWDDDADVALLRSEYEKFRKACKTELDKSRFVFQDHRNTRGYRWGYGKLRRKNTLFLREHQEHLPYMQGIFIDIFPCDGMPENKLGKWIYNGICFFGRKILYAPVGAVHETNKIKRTAYRVLRLMPKEFAFFLFQILIERYREKRTRIKEEAE